MPPVRIPKMPHDPNTAADCKWWIDNDGSNKCEDIPDIWGIDMVDWLMWVSTDSHDSQESPSAATTNSAKKRLLTQYVVF